MKLTVAVLPFDVDDPELWGGDYGDRVIERRY